MMFEVGMLVVCVDGRWGNWCHQFHPRLPSTGEIFTIRDIRERDGQVGLYFEEIVSSLNRGIEQAFGPEQFRPVRKTSIEELRKLVAPVPRQPVPAE